MDRFLADLPAFRKLPGPALAELRRRLVLKSYKKAEPIFGEGMPADAVYLLRAGLVKAVKYSPRAEPASMEIITPGQLFGMIAIMDKKPYPVSAIPLSACQAYRIPSALFISQLTEHPEFSKQVYVSVGDHLRQAQTLRAMSGETVERRIAHILCVLSQSMGRLLVVRREDIAELAGCTQETAIRTLATFRRKGIISSGWKRITVLQPERLRRLVEQD